ncbi:ABC transporter permease [Pollutimonas sp. M17]|uniref:ABC transporter permease n=1 Tax=Pollutimonas sp. M17 TaxID=2962065 RepID=UPI0021F4A2F4|nr:ABC transporter permease [Pollutimonas sp. M17]UYO95461.1 ABC transporter permease [Pollutimonas sp. M17]
MRRGPAPLIELRGICKQYGGADGTRGGGPEIRVLHDVDLTIDGGEFVAIVGASGSGKSTLMHILGCLDKPTSGSYLYGGRDVADLGADELAWLRRQAFGFVFQGYHLIATESALENVGVPAIYAGMPEAARMQRASALLERLGLADKLHNRPKQLSGGQQQRVSIARALMNGGRILLADEPTGALDSRSGAEVMSLLRELAAQGHTVILITHDREIASQASRIIEIRDGAIVSDSAAGFRRGRASSDVLEFGGSDAARDAMAAAWLGLCEAMRTAWRGMCIHRSRSILTLLGVVIGVASVIVMMAVGEGARQRIVAQMGTLGTTVMYMGSRSPSGGGPQGILTLEDLDAIAELPDIRRVMPVIGDPITVRFGNAGRLVYVFASNNSMPAVHRWELALGRYYTDAEDRGLAAVAVMGSKAREHFFPDGRNPIGSQLLIGNSPFEIIGVMTERGAESGAQSYDEMVFIPYQSGRARVYQAQTQPDYVVIEAVSPDVVLAAEAAMTELLLDRHGGRDDFSVSNAAAKLQAEAETRNAMTMMLGLIAAVSLVVGGIGVMTVMLMAVRERRKEIGIRIATGARQRDILRQFLVEAILLTVLGGGAGVLSGLIVGAVLIAMGVPLVFSASAILGAFGCAVATGLLFGYMPARSAARLEPVLALAGD